MHAQLFVGLEEGLQSGLELISTQLNPSSWECSIAVQLAHINIRHMIFA